MDKNEFNIENGWFENVIINASPNRNTRPNPSDIRLIIIHNISLPPNQFGGSYIDDFFCNRLRKEDHPYFEEIHQLKVSPHLFIKRNGDITQFVPFHERAWHAGISTYKGQENCNDFSIGIELEGADHIPYTPEQYQQLTQCCEALIEYYPLLNTDNITGHSDISPGRKTDPGESFDWGFIEEI